MTGTSTRLGEIAARLHAANDRFNALELRDELVAGQTIHYDRYLIHGVLGRGSFATVYDAEHLGLGRRVAIKVPRLRPDHLPSLHERFVREARTSALVHHRNVLGIYDCGALPDGAPFLVLERVNGDSLSAIIERGPLSFEMVIELGRQLARALTALADVGVVHRDIKPENVMLHRTKFGIMLVKLVDFGVAKRSTWQAPATITLQGELVGTPQYMAPEQLRGEEVDGRTDIYALAAVLYEALTGQPAHECVNFSDYLVSTLSTPARPVRELRPDCPLSLEKTVLRALERDRERRHNTPEQLLEELEACMVELKGDASRRIALARESRHDLARPSQPPSMLSYARSLMSQRLHFELSDSWQQRIASAREKLDPLLQRSGIIARRAAPNVAFLSLLTGLFFTLLLVFSHSMSLVWPSEPAITQRAPTIIPAQPAAPVAARKLRLSPPGGSVNPRMVEPSLARDPELPARSSTPLAVPPNTKLAGPPIVTAALPARERVEAPSRARVLPAAPPAKPQAALGARAQPGPASKPGAAERPKEPVSALLAQAFAAYVSSHPDEAKSRYEQVLRSEPNNAAALRGLGLSTAQLGDKATARNSLRRYLEISPHAPDSAAIERRLASLTP
jgi:serine/threonine protein kinase